MSRGLGDVYKRQVGGRAEGDKLFHIVYIETTGRIRQLVKITLSVFMSFLHGCFFIL